MRMLIFAIVGAACFMVAYAFGLGGTVSTLIFLFVLTFVWAVAGFLSFRKGVEKANQRLDRSVPPALAHQNGMPLTRATTLPLLGRDYPNTDQSTPEPATPPRRRRAASRPAGPPVHVPTPEPAAAEPVAQPAAVAPVTPPFFTHPNPPASRWHHRALPQSGCRLPERIFLSPVQRHAGRLHREGR